MENSLETVGRKFFDKPEGKVGKVFLYLIGIGALVALYMALPFIITLLANTLYALLLLGSIALLIFLVTNKQIQTIVSFGFQMIMRSITGVFVELNPIAIIKIHISNLERNHIVMNDQITKLSGELRGLERKIEDNKHDIEKSLKIASAAKEKEEKGQVWIETRKAGRRTEGTIKLSDVLSKIKKIYNVLKKMYEVSGYVIEDLKDDVEQREIKYNTVRQAHAALAASMSILNGNPNERAMYELALEKMEEEVCQKLGTMDRFMDMSENLVKSIDIEQGIFAADGMKMLEEYDKNGFDSFFNDFESQPNKPAGSYTQNKPFDVSEPIERDTVTGKYF